MRRFSQLIIFLFLMILLSGNICVPSVYSLHCAQHDQSSLLQLKHSLVLYSYGYGSSNLDTWNSSSDCCVWGGITCSPGGDVIALDLSRQSISGGIDDSNSPLFDLHHLQSLDLSFNDFNGTQIPSGIGKLAYLLHLNLSDSGLGGQVPIEISSLTRLLTLKLGNDFRMHEMELENPKLSTLVKNLTNLIELNLDGVNMSTEGEGYQWGDALSSSLPNLQVLSLSGCSLSGPLHHSLVKLQALTSIDLSANNLSTALPDFLVSFTNLTSLVLSNCGLHGNFPPVIFRIPRLQYLDLNGNKLLSGTLPDLIDNSKTLEFLILQGCGFSSSITHIHWEYLENLAYLILGENMLSGSVPPSLFALPSLFQLDLSSNQFSGQLAEVESANFGVLDVSSNKFEGPVPSYILNLGSLIELRLSYNNFSGTIDLTDLFQSLGNLSYIDLSFNSLSIIQSVASPSSNMAVPQLYVVTLASCNLKKFPSLLRNQSRLSYLDLSENEIFGLVPNWIWQSVRSLIDLSHNSLIGFEFPSLLRNQSRLSNLDLSKNEIFGLVPNWIWESTDYSIDLSHNSLIGFETLLPNFTSSLKVLNLKSNRLQGQVPLQVGNYFPNLTFLSLSSNDFHGSIPLSLCNLGRDNKVVDLSNNSLSGTIPPCLLAMNSGVLNLKRNNLSGSIPDVFRGNCSLQTLDLSENRLQGSIPKSMANCKALKVINLGSNDLSGGFPCWLIHVSNLTVLVLRSNRFYGPISCATSNSATYSWSKLQIIDIAVNSFGGKLPHNSFQNWTTMMTGTNVAKPKLDYLAFGDLAFRGFYQDTVRIINKGVFVELEKILIIYDAIDFSCNNFEGSIPHSVGDLTSLYALNLSHNRFEGPIPSSIGSLRAMEALDLANNSLSGAIPEELASLTFISYLNLSFNHLVGRIPTSTQLQSFLESSYAGNKGLYGPPLDGSRGPPVDPSPANAAEKEIDWQLICIEIGYAIGLGSVIGSLMFWKRWNLWYFGHVDRLVFKIFASMDPHKRNNGTRVHKRS